MKSMHFRTRSLNVRNKGSFRKNRGTKDQRGPLGQAEALRYVSRTRALTGHPLAAILNLMTAYL